VNEVLARAIPLLFFLAVLGLTIFLQQWLHRHIQGLTLALTGNSGFALRLLFYLLLPGVLLHEASHYLFAKLLFVRVTGFNIGIGAIDKRQVSLGSVHLQRSDPIRESLIGAAPFVIGISAIWLIVGYGFDLWPAGGLAFGRFIDGVREYAGDWTTWLDVYLIFAVSTSMIPSESDREPWALIIAIIGLVTLVAVLAGWWSRIPGGMMALASQLIDALTFALGIVVSVNGAFAVLLLLIERTVGQISGTQVEYRVKRK
jgi:hypothetical protein